MKWPKTVTIVRHGESGYNILKTIKRDNDSDFSRFKIQFQKEFAKAKDENWVSDELLELAKKARKELAKTFSRGDYSTPLTKEGVRQAEETGRNLLKHIDPPGFIYVSPYLRTRQTLASMIKACPQLKKAKIIPEERIREQEHGLSTIYNDWRIYLAFNPEQGVLYRRSSDYEYRFLNGENKADVRDRVRDFTGTLIRELPNENVLLVTHHLTILCFRSNIERWGREKFISVDRGESPINCGLTIYEGDPTQGKNGRLILREYNKRIYK